MKNEKPTIELSEQNGNAMMLLAKAKKKAKKNNMDWEKIEEEAKSGDYNNLIQTLQKYFEVV